MGSHHIPHSPRESMAAMTFEIACDAVKDVKLEYSPSPVLLDRGAQPTVDISGMPFKCAANGNTAVVHVFDYIVDTEYKPLTDDVQQMLANKMYSGLPAPFAPAVHVDQPYTMDVLIWRKDEHTMIVLKHFRAIGGRFPRSVAKSLCRGTPKIIDMSLRPQGQTTMKALVHMFDNAGGVQCRSSKLVPLGGAHQIQTSTPSTLGTTSSKRSAQLRQRIWSACAGCQSKS